VTSFPQEGILILIQFGFKSLGSSGNQGVSVYFCSTLSSKWLYIISYDILLMGNDWMNTIKLWAGLIGLAIVFSAMSYVITLVFQGVL
jgi:hypothetical protein